MSNYSSGLASAGRPPYVRFEWETEEDRDASIREGHYVPRNVAIAFITAAGSRDELQANAEEWIARIADQAKNGFYPPEWAEGFAKYYKGWKEGQEIPATGFSVRSWAAISRAEAEMLMNANIRTVEDLAEANDVALSRMGPAGSALKRKAVEWMKSANDIGKVAEEVAALKVNFAALNEENERLSRENAEMRRELAGVRELRTARK